METSQSLKFNRQGQSKPHGPKVFSTINPHMLEHDNVLEVYYFSELDDKKAKELILACYTNIIESENPRGIKILREDYEQFLNSVSIFG